MARVGDILLGEYKVVEIISGEGDSLGGMSNVYKVVSKDLADKFWALKEVNLDKHDRATAEQKALLHEAKLLVKLNHPFIPRITTTKTTKHTRFIVMDWVEGVPVSQLIHSKEMTQAKALDISIKICEILGYLHNRPIPILYRDMKPQNLMYQSNGNVMLIDFGISVEVDGRPLPDRRSSLGYLDPYALAVGERKLKEGVPPRYPDLRSDIYSLGWTMFHMFTGISPLVYKRLLEKNKEKGLPEDTSRDPRLVSPDISPYIAKIIMKATEPLLEDRYSSIEELRYDLEDVENQEKGTNKVKKKRLRTVFSLFALGTALMGSSIVPYLSHQNLKKDRYTVLVDTATKTGKMSDFLKVIEYNPNDITPYFGMLDAIKSDGQFTPEEEKDLLDSVNSNISFIQKDKRYKQFAFEIGRLYWLYYTGKDGESISSRWFKDAKDYSDLAPVYASIGSFQSDITKYANEGDDAGRYKKQWELLNSVTGQSDLVTLQVDKAKLTLITNYIYRLKSDGVSKDSLESTLNGIESFINNQKDAQGRQEDIINEIKVNLLNQAKSVVSEAYAS